MFTNNVEILEIDTLNQTLLINMYASLTQDFHQNMN